ncbi:hypothetical protein FQA39_LY01248 [Lamprigera yunnana]|nr:hypothetical protein FQA39_LY01248 [Lamprigera yunnana]
MASKVFVLIFLLLNTIFTKTGSTNTTALFDYASVFSHPTSFGNHILTQLEKRDARFISANCIQHLMEYANNLIKFEPWAFQLFDASEKLPSGMSKGNGAGLGNFDQCIALKQNTSVGTISGKYCLGGLTVFNFDDPLSISKSPQSRFIHYEEENFLLLWGICLPDSCSADDFRFVTLTIFDYSESLCQTNESQSIEFDTLDYVTIVLISVVIAIVVLATVLERVSSNTKKRTHSSIICFSLTSNLDSILNNAEEEEITCLNGLRSFTLMFITIGLRFIMYPMSPLTNWVDLMEWVTNRYKVMLLEAFLCVDTFFVISGTLLSYIYLERTKKGQKFNIFIFYLNRIIRFTPALAFAVLVNTSIMRHIGSGPVWPTIRNRFIVHPCREYWWSTLLYVQNYVNPELTNTCILPSWFLSVDMQLVILSPILLLPLTRFPKYTLGFIGFIFVCSILSSFLVTWVYELHAVVSQNIFPTMLEKYMTYFLEPLHTRASTWILGFLLGYILHYSKNEKNQLVIRNIMTPAVTIFLWFVSIGLIIFCITISQAFIEDEYNWIPNAFHFAFVRPLWGVAIAWIIFACFHGLGGPVNTFLSNTIFRCISRISYCTYLLNFIVLIIFTSQTRTGLTFSISGPISNMWNDIVWCLLVGLAWSLLFERPFIVLFKNLTYKFSKTSKIHS